MRLVVHRLLNQFPLLGLLLIVSGVFGQQSPADSTTRSIKLADIQTEYEKVILEIPLILKKYADSTTLQSLSTAYEKQSRAFEESKKETDELLAGYIRSWQIKNLEARLNRSNSVFNDLSNNVNSASFEFENLLLKIGDQISSWTTVQNRIKNDSISKGLFPQTQEALSLLARAQKLLQGQFAQILVFQNQINQYQIELTEYLEKVEKADKESFTKLFERESNFIWNVTFDREIENERQETFLVSFRHGAQESIDYIIEKWRVFIWLIFLGTGLYLVFYLLGKKQPLVEEEKTPLLADSAIIKYPIASSTITILLITFFVLDNRPALFTEMLLIGFSLPLIIFSLSKTVASKWIYWMLILIYAMDVMLHHIPLRMLTQNILFFVLSVMTNGLLFWMNKNHTKYLTNYNSPIALFLKTRLIPIFFYISIVAFITAMFGYIALAKLIITGIVSSLYVGPVILICSLIIQNFITILSHTFVLENSFLAKKYLPWLLKIVSASAFLLWLKAFLMAFGIYPFFLSSIQDFWNFGGDFGEFHISISDVTSVFFILITSYVLSNFVKILLEEEVLSRFRVPRGVPMAMGVMGKYFILLIGFFLAIASTGFDLTKMSILAGALGVGVGFGLQNLVANFVSGLILIFERPILVGDIIEAEGVEGQVTQIGIRASKMMTYAGAEVIIPNSNLISNRVSNWTLSNRRRRFTIEIRTSKNANPSEVVAAITSIVFRHIHVIKDPKPFVIFGGQLEQSLLFKVYYWQVGELLITRSELNLQIYETLKDQGIAISIPVYEIKNIE